MHLTKAYSKYGASMGRRDTHGDPDTTARFSVARVPLSGDYDSGGAYWGAGRPLYRALAETEDNEQIEFFLRADSRELALDIVKRHYPNARFARGKRRVVSVPPCAAYMGCLCAGHARGNSADAPCDTTEGVR